MDKVCYQNAICTCAMAAQLLAQHDLGAILKSIHDAEAVGPILDPTLYRNKAGAMEEDKSLIEAALPLARWFERKEDKA